MNETLNLHRQRTKWTADIELDNFFPGDASNREIVARKCGNEFDRYLACGSRGENLGIAASGDVRCCNNRSQLEN